MQDFNKQNPEELSEEEQAKLARHSLIEYLSRRDNSKYELRQKLKQKGISKQIFIGIRKDEQNINYLNDFITQAKKTK